MECSVWEMLKLAGKIDARVQRLQKRGCDDMTILAKMADHMPEFKRLMRMAGKDGMGELCGRFPGLLRYAKILESVGRGIRSGEIKIPG
jgi:hypothetical protein